MLTALWIGALNNDAHLELSGESEGPGRTYRLVGDPTEGALLVAAAKAGVLPRPLNQSYPRVAEIPFDATRKNMITVHHIFEPREADSSPFDESHKDSGYVIAVKGAPDMVLNLCTRYQRRDDSPAPLDEAQRRSILEANEAMTRDALRVLGLAYPRGARASRCQRHPADRKRPGLRRPGRHDRPAAAGSGPRPGRSHPGRHPHHHDHRRFSQHRPGHRRLHRPAAPGPPGADREAGRRPGATTS